MTEERHDTVAEERREATNGHSCHGVSFLKGLFAGALVGTAAGILVAPRAQATLRALRRQVTEAAATIGDAAVDGYRQAGAQVSDAVDDLHDKGREAYGKVLRAVVHGAQEVKTLATEAGTERHRPAPKASARRSS